MNIAPFSLFRSHQDIADVRLMTREDGVSSDEDFARLTEAKKLVGLQQEHGNRAVVVREISSRILKADALATDVKNLTLSVRFADCQNAVLLAPKHRVVCLVHAGWRGVRSRIMTSAYALLRDEWNIRPEDTLVGLGPALCINCAEFTDPLSEAPELRAFTHGRCIDLRGALDEELADIGLPTSQIERLPDCTRCRPEIYFTYRGGDKELVKNGFVNGMSVRLV